MSKADHWGYHLLLDVAACDPDIIKNKKALQKFAADLVTFLDMKAYGKPMVVHFGHKEEHLTGWTVVQLIETSNITCHFVDADNTGYIDIFSCMPFTGDSVKNYVTSYLDCEVINSTFLTRKTWV